MNQIMKDKSIVVEEILNAPVETVWQALTDKNKMKKWYFDLSDFKPEIDFQFSFPGQGSKGEKYVHLCRVTKVIPNKLLQYSWRYENHEGNSLVSFELSAEGNKTVLRLTHEGIDTFPKSNSDFAIESFIEGWTQLITKSLPKYLSVSISTGC